MNISRLQQTYGGDLVLSTNHSLEKEISGTSSIENYRASTVSYVSSNRFLAFARNLRDAVVILDSTLEGELTDNEPNTYLVVDDAFVTMTKVQAHFYDRSTDQPDLDASLVTSTAYVSDAASIGENVKIFPGARILAGSTIGANTVVMPNVTIYPGVVVGENCVVHSGTVIGADGFRHEIRDDAVHKFVHAGNVRVGANVEIGANCTIDRATFEDESTVLEESVRLDDQVHIGHNAKIGPRTMIAAQTCISGSVTTGEQCWIGAGVTVADRISIGVGVRVLVNAVVASNVDDGEVISGFYAMPHKKWRRLTALWRRQV